MVGLVTIDSPTTTYSVGHNGDHSQLCGPLWPFVYLHL